jgi:hypothetical protein
VIPPSWVEQLTQYLREAEGFSIKIPDYGHYDHMGATLTETILQQGLKYEQQVKPVVEGIRRIPEARTTSGFLNGVDIPTIVGYGYKGIAIAEVARFLQRHAIETEDELKTWLQREDHVTALQSLNHIGPKSCDYLKNLVGIEGVAVDSHIREVVHEAGVPRSASYEQIQSVVELAASALGVSGYVLDYSIWVWRAGGSTTKRPSPTPSVVGKSVQNTTAPPRRAPRQSNPISRQLFQELLNQHGFVIERPQATQGDLHVLDGQGGSWRVTIRSSRNRGYCCVPKSSWPNLDRQLLGLASFNAEGQNDHLYLIPAVAWIKGGPLLKRVLKDRDYAKPGLKSKPEWGVDTQHNLLAPFLQENVLRSGVAQFHFPRPEDI